MVPTKMSGKRIFDISLAVIGLVISAPLLGVIAAMIWLESPGKIIFSQERLGLHGRRFRMYKFRKFPTHMKNDGPGLTARNDARMTRVGKVLERTKFDELPQLWNILKGDMAFVGPRPESTKFADLFISEYACILNYVPGIFGPSQVKFRNECELYPAEEDMEEFYRRELFPQKAECDHAYFRKATLFSDIFQILKGIWVSVVGLFNWWDFLHAHYRLVVLDFFLIGISWGSGNILYSSGFPAAWDSGHLLKSFFLVPPLLVFSMFVGGVYKYPLKYFSLYDLGKLLLTITIAWHLIFLLLLILQTKISFYLVLTVFFILIAILPLPRLIYHFRRRRLLPKKNDSSERIVIYGAGQAGFALATWISNGKLVGFLDDNPNLKGKRIRGYSILGYENDIRSVYNRYPFDQIWLAFKPSKKKLSRLQMLCHQKEIDLFVLPDIKPFDVLY